MLPRARSHYCIDRPAGEMVRCPYITGDGGFCTDPGRDASRAHEPCARVSDEAIAASVAANSRSRT